MEINLHRESLLRDCIKPDPVKTYQKVATVTLIKTHQASSQNAQCAAPVSALTGENTHETLRQPARKRPTPSTGGASSGPHLTLQWRP